MSVVIFKGGKKIFMDYGKWKDQAYQTKDVIIKTLTKEIEALKNRVEILENKIKSEFFSIH